MNIDKVLEKDNNGNYILTEGEIFEYIKHTPEIVISYNFDKILAALSIKNRVELLKLGLVKRNFQIRKIVSTIRNFELFKEAIQYIPSDYDYIDETAEIIKTFSDQQKSELLPNVKCERLIYEIILYMNDEVKKAYINHIENEKRKLSIVGSLEDDEEKIKLLPELKTDFDKAYIIYCMKQDENKAKYINNITTDKYKKEIIANMTNPNMILEAIKNIDKIDNDFIVYISKKFDDANKVKILKLADKEFNIYVLNYVLNSINDTNKFIEGCKELNFLDISSVLTKNRLELLTDEQKIELISYMNDNHSSTAKKIDIILNLKNDSDKIKILKNITDNHNKAAIIKSFNNDINKVKILPSIDDEYYKREIINTIQDDDIKISALKYLQEESNKALVISTLKDINKKLELLDTINDSKLTIIKSIKDDKVLAQLQNKYDDDELRNQIILLIENEATKINLSKYISDEKILLKLIKNLSIAGRILFVNTIDNPRAQVSAIKLFDDEKIVLQLAGKIKSEVGRSLYEISIALSDQSKIQLLKLPSLRKDDYYRQEIIGNVKTYEFLLEGLDYCPTVPYKIIEKIIAFDDAKKIEVIPHIFDDYSIKKIIESLSKEEDKIKCLKYLKNIYIKSDIIKTLSRDNALVATTNLINNEINLSTAEYHAKNLDYPMERFEEMKRLEKEAIKSSSNIDFKNKFEKLNGYASKYRAIIAYKPVSNDIELFDNIIINFVNETKNIEERYAIIKKISLDGIEIFKKELITAFDKGLYKNLEVFDEEVFKKIFDSKKVKVMKEYKNLTGQAKIRFRNFIHENYDKISESKIDEIHQLIIEIENSNSEEISKQSNAFITNLLTVDTTIEKFREIEKVFLKNNLPRFAKTYLTFLIVHPNFDSYIFENTGGHGHTVSSKVLNQISPVRRKALILSDLIKCSLKSNSNNFVFYINNLQRMNNIYLENRDKDYELLDDKAKHDLKEFRDCILTLYDNYLIHKNIKSTNDIINDLNIMNNILCKNNDGMLADSIISGYCKLIGINSIDEAKEYISKTMAETNKKNKSRYEKNDFKIEQGDFIKGFDINYFFDMANNGIVAKDYLGADMATDMTALDTDLSRIFKKTTNMNISEIIDQKNDDSGMFGQAYIILKDNPELINITRKTSGEDYSRKDTIKIEDIFNNKLEAFSNGDNGCISYPYGIRTGFSISDIDFIVFDENGGKYRENIYKIILPLVMNNIYIPIVSKQTEEVLFTYEEFIKLTSKMSGLKKYGQENFKISPNINCEQYEKIADEIDNSNKKINDIKEKIFNTIKDGLGNNFNIVNCITGKLETREVQILDTGSTSRTTNIPYEGDFDFVVRIDRNIDINNNLKQDFIKALISKFDIVDPGRNIEGDIKEMIIVIDEKKYKIDLSFVRKTDKISYSTEICIKDRLDTIEKKYPEKYKLILANIVYAKKYLKSNLCYKKGQYGEGGLGGVGVENWILQNNGSFYDAAVDFISHAYKGEQQISFDNFIKKYQVWDFGENFYTDRENIKNKKNANLHDNFISNNLTEEGYNKMCSCLKKFISDYELGTIEELIQSEDKQEIQKHSL